MATDVHIKKYIPYIKTDVNCKSVTREESESLSTLRDIAVNF